MSYTAVIEARIAGIPCKVGVSHFMHHAGSYSYHAASDYDYEGYTEIEFEVLDRNGRKAPWLERKMSDKDVMAVESSIIKYFEEEAEYDY